MTKNFYSISLSVLLGLCGMLFAAAPATHVFFAERYIKECKPSYTKKERQAFIRGTLFPDIRYLAHIPRNKTHSAKIKLKQIIEQKDPFIAGKLFHSFVDEQRQRIVQREKIHNTLSFFPEKIRHQLLKIIEDELCYHAIDRANVLEALKTHDAIEKKQGVPFYTVKTWHRHLATYLQQVPTALFNERARQKKGYLMIPAALIAQWSGFVTDHAKNKKVKAYFVTLTAEFDKIFNTQTHTAAKKKNFLTF